MTELMNKAKLDAIAEDITEHVLADMDQRIKDLVEFLELPDVEYDEVVAKVKELVKEAIDG